MLNEVFQSLQSEIDALNARSEYNDVSLNIRFFPLKEDYATYLREVAHALCVGPEEIVVSHYVEKSAIAEAIHSFFWSWYSLLDVMSRGEFEQFLQTKVLPLLNNTFPLAVVQKAYVASKMHRSDASVNVLLLVSQDRVFQLECVCHFY